LPLHSLARQGRGVAGPVLDTGVGEARAAQAAAIAEPASKPFVGGIVARPAHRRIEPEPVRFLRDTGLAPFLKRRVNAERLSFGAFLRREPRSLGEAGDELRPAIRITGIIERVDANEDVMRADRLRPAEREREEDEIARGNVSYRNVVAAADALLRHVEIIGERGAAELAQVEREDDVPRRAEVAGDRP